jgi:DNA-binding CsgD family transcriptional regulator
MITHPDALRLLDFVAGLQECRRRDDFGADLIRLMASLVPSSLIAYDQIEERSGTYELSHNSPLDAQDTAKFLTRLQQVYQQNPIYGYIQSGGPQRVVDIDHLCTQRQLQRTDFYQDIFKPLGVRHQVNVLLPRQGWITALTINHDKPFSAEQHQLLNLASRHILLAHRNVCLNAEIQRSAEALATRQPRLTPREQEVLHWLGEGKRNSEIATILGCSTRTIEKHVENILAKTGTETRTAAAQTKPHG